MTEIKTVFKKFLWVIFKAVEISSFLGMIICLGLVPWTLEMTLFGLFPLNDMLFSFFVSLALYFLFFYLVRYLCRMIIYCIDQNIIGEIIDAMFGGM